MKLEDKYRIVESDNMNNDCTECVFSLICFFNCTLPRGYHYEERTTL